MNIKETILIMRIKWMLRGKTREEKIRMITKAVIGIEIDNAIKDEIRTHYRGSTI